MSILNVHRPNFGGTAFFTTQSGFFGAIFNPVKEGDILCTIFGCDYCAILRPIDNGAYDLITLAVFIDVMDPSTIGKLDFNNGREFCIR